MKDNFIQLNKDNILRLEIKASDGTSTGEHLEFDLEDIELPLKYQDLVDNDKKNRQNLRNQLHIIEKRQDVKGKKLLSKNEEDAIKAYQDFFKKETEVYDLFLGDRGTEKLLCGRKLGWTSLKEIDEIIEKQIMPHLKVNADMIKNKIIEKYSVKENEVLR